TKPYAKKMEGLGRVHDGSTGDISTGYWQMNLIGVAPESSSTVLASSRLYSFKTELEPPELSENSIILEEIKRIDRHIQNKQIVVIDRGGDRRILIERFLQAERPFIIRQTGKRHVEHRSRRKRVDTVGKATKLKWTIAVPCWRGGKRLIHQFNCGAVRVKFPHEHCEGNWEQSLWLVTAQRSGKGRCYFLSYIDARTAEEAVRQVMEGYGCRWRIEEVHRQVKQDYRYESVSLRRYTAFRNFNTLFWMTMGFLYQQLEDISLKLILEFREPLIYTGRLRDLGNFYLYKLSRVVMDLLRFTKIRGPSKYHKINSPQLDLCIE
ncbi:MAG: transposase, partial [Desulfobacterales bacterium]|nr:transposase [Desulfobacterales bacterium]